MSDTETSKSFDPTEVESRWYPFWTEKGYFRADPESPKPPFCIVLPPPNVTGSLHLGHALTATIQDVLTRWKRMSGYECLWLPGTDHAGIATQMVVERELKKTEGKSRHDLGRKAFLERVWQWKEKYGARIGEQHKVLGASLDWSRERFTMDEGLSHAVREVFVRLHEEGLIYRAQKLINWCPSCRTALSDLEVEHEERDGSLWHIRYPVKGTDRFLTVATTRPETMLGDTAVAVHPEDERYRDLIGKTVALPLTDREIPIIADAELVNREFGTGVVKVTPAHDFNDYQTGLRHKLPMVTVFDEAAKVNENGYAFVGQDRFEARKNVLAALQELGLLEKEEPHKLSIGECQRSRTVVEPRLSPQWFVKIEPLAKPAIEAVEKGETRFLPETWTQVYFHWMNNIHDWCISRQLWWGHQIPAWYCKACSPDTRDMAKAKPHVQRTAPEKCSECGGGDFVQDEDVLDTWFSSALWPFSTLGWPEKTKELAKFYPTSVMETGHDIIFFWVARMMMMGLHFMGEVPFKTVYLHAMVRDEKGEKMSKVKGNVIDPLDVVRGAPKDNLPKSVANKFPDGMPAFGADALRFTLAALTQQGRDIKLSLDRVGGYKAFVNKLWNASRFAMMNLGDFRADDTPITDRKLSLADRWVLSRLDRAVEQTELALTEFRFSDAASALYQFVWYELCDWYIELSKIAINGSDEEAREACRATLVYCLDNVLRLLHPFMPFITEELWQKLPMTRDAESIMVAQFPVARRELRDEAAEREMAPIVAAIEGIRSIRGESNLPPREKLKAHVQSSDDALRGTVEKWKHYLMPLAGLSAVTVERPGNKPPQSAAWVGQGLEVYVPLAGVIDFEEERKRIHKEIAGVDKDLALLTKKLDNPSFVERAPAEVVAKDRARVEELRERRAKLQDNLARIGEDAAAKSEPAQTVAEAVKADLEALAATPSANDAPAEDSAAYPPAEAAKGLTPKDQYELGVSYMDMGMVEHAMQAFDEAERNADELNAPGASGDDNMRADGGSSGVTPSASVVGTPAEEVPGTSRRGATRRAPAKKGAAKKGAAKKSAAKKGAAKKSAAKKGAAKKGAAKKGAAKKGAAKKGAAKKGAAKKGAAKKGAAKKGAAKKGAAKKGAAKKGGAKKAAKGRTKR